ncbi:S1C family serine protease [Stenomitos frigidus]|uniref:Serine protease n=1 Tax=Stenomitos frigidus ULC18 TaxID=2107698 RepID=A0A2T1DZS3_9CYAN|nr:trypsin-like peptidase domain-containing protein [Stenomitos frigidus]PSB25997.1 serine protease [Stenomitos frigidus ULC18]
MKFKYLLLLAFSVWLVGVTASIAAPIRAVSRLTTATRFTPEADTAPDTYRNCQTKSPAVLTVYAGNETGSGSIVSPEGLVITSNHVIKDRGGQPIIVRTANGEQYRGRVIKTDTHNDLALLQLEAQNQFPIVPLASTSDVEIGQSVCAIGSPYGRPGVLSEGTLSLVRNNGDLQASIRLYPGNSGGPLLNPQGEMIGVNKAILESPSGRNTGISFATNVQAVRNLLGSSFAAKPLAVAPLVSPSIAESPATEWTWTAPEAPAQQPIPSPDVVKPSAPSTNRPAAGRRLGMTIDIRNLVVQRVQPGSAAAVSGFRPGDKLLAINGNRIGGFTALQSFLDRQPDQALFTIARGQNVASVQVRF